LVISSWRLEVDASGGHGQTADICEFATRAFSGVQTFYDPDSGEVFSVDVVFIVTDDGALWNYWVDQFVCPWYPTFKQALNSPADCSFNG
jgi:hypothetical protein